MFVMDILEPHSQWIPLRLHPAWPLSHISHCWLHSSPWHILFPFMPMSPLGFLPLYLSASSFSVSVDVSSSSVHFFHVLPWGFRLTPFLTPYIIFQLYHFLFSWFSPPSVPWTQISTLDSCQPAYWACLRTPQFNTFRTKLIVSPWYTCSPLHPVFTNPLNLSCHTPLIRSLTTLCSHCLSNCPLVSPQYSAWSLAD